MKKNIGTMDRAIRFFVATVCAVVAYSRQTQDGLFWVLVIVGVIMLITAMISFCGLYAVLGISTRDKA